MNLLIAACGLDCGQCEAYLATQADDQPALERIAAKWREEYQAPSITAANVACDGCMLGERHVGYCAQCGVRACAMGRNLDNCAACADYTCKKLEDFFQMAPQARQNLEAIRLGGG
jgi:hypothetical protein